jgi:hypothetical protein
MSPNVPLSHFEARRSAIIRLLSVHNYFNTLLYYVYNEKTRGIFFGYTDCPKMSLPLLKNEPAFFCNNIREPLLFFRGAMYVVSSSGEKSLKPR